MTEPTTEQPVPEQAGVIPEPAFPFSFHDHEANLRWAQGMWLLDYFAAKAMQSRAVTAANYTTLAEHSYTIAEEMLKARAKRLGLSGNGAA